MGVLKGMIRSVEECEAGINTIKRQYLNISLYNSTGTGCIIYCVIVVFALCKQSVQSPFTQAIVVARLDAIFVAPKLHQVSNMFEPPAISRRQITLKIAPGLHVRFEVATLSAIKLASSCCDKNRLCKRAFNFRYSCLSRANSNNDAFDIFDWQC